MVDAADERGRDAAAARGALMAAEEAQRAGELIGRRFTLETVRASSASSLRRATSAALSKGAIAVIGGFDPTTCHTLDSLAVRARVLWLNTGCEAVAWRDTTSHPRAFHVAPTPAMQRGIHTSTDTASGTATSAVLWHARLETFGAAQLNERFERRFGVPMDAAAWAGWMAVKAIAESVLRTRVNDAGAADALAMYLSRPDVAFDGHKGEPLRFAADDHQLRQPMYRVSHNGDDTGSDHRASSGNSRPNEAGRSTTEGADAPIAVPTSAGLLVVSNEGSNSITILDATTHRPLGVIRLAGRPRGTQASPDGRQVLVALSDPAPNALGDGDAIVAIDPRTGRIVSRHRAGSDPEQFAIAPDGRTLYAANEDAGLATITDLTSGKELASLAVGIEPEGVAVSPDGRWAYITAETSNTVSVIDTRARRVVASFLTDVRPRAVAFAPDGRAAYVTNEISGTLSIIEVRRHAVHRVVEIGEGTKPVGVAAAPDGRHVYVACGGTGTVAVIDAVRGAVVHRIPVGRRPWGLTVSPDGRFVYSANGGTGDVSVVDVVTRSVVATVPVGERPWGVTYVPAAR